MGTKSDMSLRSKKILAGIGIVFGTIVVFLVSFALSFSLIVNPINLFTFEDSDALKENEELKKEVQTLTDEVELLNVTVDKYKAAAAAPASAIVTTPQPEQQGSAQSQGTSKTEPEKKPESPQNEVQQGDDKFAPETVTGTAEETPEDVEEPITVIDIEV